MANTLSLVAKLFFDGGQAISEMSKVSAAFAGMGKQTSRVKEGGEQVSKGTRGIGMATAALQVGIGASVKRLADFDAAMGGVKAKLGEEARPAFQMLEKEAMRLGATTQFTAAEAAKGMEELAAGGMKPLEIMKAIAPVLDTAAAEGMNLGDAAKIVSQNMNAFGKASGGATNVADTLAKVSSLTSSSILSLQEGLKYAAGTARQAGVPFQQTVAILGALSDVGLEGSLAGTAFQNSILKMSQSAKNGKVEVGDYFAKIEYGKDGVMDARATFMNMVTAIGKIKDPMKKVQTAQEAFGIRGKGVALAMEALTPEKTADLFTKLAGSTKGAAAEMAKLRMEGIQGDLIRVRSALDGAAIGLGRMFAPQVKAGTAYLTKFFGDATTAMRLFGSGVSVTDSRFSSLNQTAVQVVRGFKEGWASASSIITSVASSLHSVGKAVYAIINPSSVFDPKGGNLGVGNMIKLAMQVGAVALAFKVVGGTLMRVKDVAVGSFKIIGGLLGGVKTGVGGLVTLLAQRFPAIGKLAGPLGKLGKGVAAMEKITAQPVRVVNFDEMGAAGTGVAPGQLGLPGMGGPTAPGAPTVKPAIGLGVGVAAAVGGGIALNMIQGEMSGPVKTLGNTVLGVASMFGPVGMAVGGMAAGAMAFGSKIDEWTGASNWISKSLWNAGEATRKMASDAYMQAYASNLNYKVMNEQAQALIGFATRGGVQTEPGGAKRAVTAELIQERITKYATAMKMKPEETQAMVKAVMDQMGPKLAEAMKNVKVEATLNVDGRPVAKGVAGAEQENASRRGAAKPGARSQAARR